MMNESVSIGFVGIFFMVAGDLLLDAVPLSQGEHYGQAVGFSGHYDFWEALSPKTSIETLFKSHDYDYYPRGRVVFFKNTGRYSLYADACLNQRDLEKVVKAFQLSNYRLARDEHYQCAICNQDYVDF